MAIEIPIHVISLSTRSDRREKLVEEFQKHGISNYTITDAVHGGTLDVDALESEGTVNFRHRRLTRGEYGCYLSHLAAMNTILASPVELHMVLEDDVCFVDRFQARLDELLDKVREVEWDIFYLGFNCSWPECRRGLFVGRKRDGIYFPSHPVWGSQAYLIKRATVAGIIDKLLPIVLPIDVFLMTMVEIRKLGLINPIVKVHDTSSDTQAIL